MTDIRPRQFTEDFEDQDLEALYDASAPEEAGPASFNPEPAPAAPAAQPAANDKKLFGVTPTADVAMQIAGGVEEGFKNSMNAVFAIGEEVNKMLPENYQMEDLNDIERFDLADPIFPKTEREGVSGGLLDFTRAASQFLIPFGLASKGLRSVAGLKGAANMASATAATGYFALDPAEGNLANVIETVPALQNPITEFLASDGQDNSMNRFKGAISEVLTLGALDQAVKGVAKGVKVAAENPAVKKGVNAAGQNIQKLVDNFVGGVKAVKDRRDLAKQGFNSDSIKQLAEVKKVVNQDINLAEEVTGAVATAASRERADGILKGVIKVGGTAPAAKPQFVAKAAKVKDELVSRVFGKTTAEFDTTKVLKSAGLVDDPVVSDLMKFASEQTPKTKLSWNDTNARALGMTAEEATKRFGTAGDFTAAIGAVKNEAIVRASRLAEMINKKGLDNPESVEALAQFLETSNIEKMMSGEAGRALGSLKQTKSVADVLQNVDAITKKQIEAALKSFAGDPEKLLGFGRSIGRSKVADLKAGLQSFWVNNVLSGPVTHLTNITSNVAFLALRPIERLGASGVGVLRGSDRAMAKEALEMYHGYYEGMRDALRSITRAEPMDKALMDVVRKGSKFDDSRSLAAERGNMVVRKAITGREEMLSLAEFKKMGPLGMGQELLARALTLPTDFLGGTDQFIKTMAARGQKRALAFRSATDEGLKGAEFDARIKSILNNSALDATDKLILNNINEASGAFARETVFQEELGRAGKAIVNLRDKVPGLQYVIPFVKTPLNIMDEAFLKRTPIGLASGRIRNQILKGGPAGDEAIARMAIGTFVSGSIAASYASGNITGAGPKNKAAREKWLETNQPWSIKINNEWYSYNKIEPMGSLLGLGARFAEVLEHNADSGVLSPEEEEELSFSLAGAFTQYVTDKSIMTGIENVLTALEGDEAGVEKFTANVAGGFVPFSGMLRTVANSSDAELRDMDGILDRIASGLPGLSENLPNRRNRFGDKVMKPERTIGFLLPISHTPGGVRDKKTLRINEIENDAGTAISKPSRNFRGIKLSLREQDARLQFFNEFKIDGIGVKDAIIQTADTEQYQALSSGTQYGKGDIIQRIYRNYLKASDETFLRQNPEISVKVDAARSASFEIEREINPRTGEPQAKERFIGAE